MFGVANLKPKSLIAPVPHADHIFSIAEIEKNVECGIGPHCDKEKRKKLRIAETVNRAEVQIARVTIVLTWGNCTHFRSLQSVSFSENFKTGAWWIEGS